MLNKKDAIGVLGKGTSLERAKQLSFLDEFIIVNDFNLCLKKEPIKSLLKNKKIINLQNLHEVVLSQELQEKYKSSIVSSRLKRDETSDKWFRKLESEYSPMPEEMEPFLFGGTSTGAIAIMYATIGLKKKNIYIAGIDFFESGYFNFDPETDETTGYFLGFWKRMKELKVSENMKKSLTDFFKKCPDKKFYFITDSTFNPKLPNVEILKGNSKEEWDKIYIRYDKEFIKAYLTRRNRYDEYFKEIKKYLFPGAKILDIGCGVGAFATKLQDYNINYLGIDQSDMGIKQAKTISPKFKFEVHDVYNYNIETKYDIIVAFDLLEHLENPEKILDKIVKNGKIIIIGTPFEGAITGTHINSIKKEFFDKYKDKIQKFNIFPFIINNEVQGDHLLVTIKNE